MHAFRGTPAPTLLFEDVNYCLASDLNKKLLLCVLSHMVYCVSSNKLYTCFYSLCLLACFQQGTKSGQFCFQPLASLVARIPGFHPACPGSIPEQRIKISLRAVTHCCHSLLSLRDETGRLVHRPHPLTRPMALKWCHLVGSFDDFQLIIWGCSALPVVICVVKFILSARCAL